jgi:FkbM family methyltransferase
MANPSTVVSMVNGRLRKLLRKSFRIELVRRFSKHPLARRIELFEKHSIDLVFDIGANLGQYGNQLRDIGYKGRIVSFEPIHAVFEELDKQAKRDQLWSTANLGIGAEDEKSTINIAGNLYSSSFLDMLPRHVKAEPKSAYIDQQEVDIKKVDSIIDSYFQPGDKLFVKMDTQGFEKFVFAGMEASWPYIEGIQVEMAIVPLYEGEFLLGDFLRFLEEKGYELVGLEPGFCDPESSELLQVDGIFFRK